MSQAELLPCASEVTVDIPVSPLTVQELFRGFWEGSYAPFWLPFLGFGMSGTDFSRCLFLCRSSLICAFCSFCLAMFDLFQFLFFALYHAFFASDKLSFCLLYSLAFLFLSFFLYCASFFSSFFNLSRYFLLLSLLVNRARNKTTKKSLAFVAVFSGTKMFSPQQIWNIKFSWKFYVFWWTFNLERLHWLLIRAFGKLYILARFPHCNQNS